MLRKHQIVGMAPKVMGNLEPLCGGLVAQDLSHPAIHNLARGFARLFRLWGDGTVHCFTFYRRKRSTSRLGRIRLSAVESSGLSICWSHQKILQTKGHRMSRKRRRWVVGKVDCWSSMAFVGGWNWPPPPGELAELGRLEEII